MKEWLTVRERQGGLSLTSPHSQSLSVSRLLTILSSSDKVFQTLYMELYFRHIYAKHKVLYMKLFYIAHQQKKIKGRSYKEKRQFFHTFNYNREQRTTLHTAYYTDFCNILQPTIDHRYNSFSNYCALFNLILSESIL